MRVLPPTGHLLPPNHFRFLGLQGSVSRISLSMTADSPIVHAKTQRAFVETRNAGRDIGARAEIRMKEGRTCRRGDDGKGGRRLCRHLRSCAGDMFRTTTALPPCHATSSNEFGSTDAKGQNFRRLMVEVARPGESKPAGRWRKQHRE